MYIVGRDRCVCRCLTPYKVNPDDIMIEKETGRTYTEADGYVDVFHTREEADEFLLGGG